MRLAQRIFREKRSAIVPLLVAIALNLLAYVLVVRPLGEKSAGASERAAAASTSLQAARRELAAAQALVAGKTQAERELTIFYDKVLPASESAARRITYAPLPELARKANVKYKESKYEAERVQKSQRIGRLRIRMVLEGEYENVRRFIYELETAPPFVIIDDVTLAQAEAGKPLALTLELSTYYRLGANGN